jgi:hypothetical protein
VYAQSRGAWAGAAQRIIRAAYGSPEFKAEYRAALVAHADELRVKTGARAGSHVHRSSPQNERK